MKNKIRQILLKQLVSNYDNGNIEDGGIGGGDEAIDDLYDLFTKQDEPQTLTEDQRLQETVDLINYNNLCARATLFPGLEIDEIPVLTIEDLKEPDVVLVNGKEYPMWNQFVAQQDKWIGGTLEEYGDSFDRAMELEMMATPITKIELRPNGEESAFFEVHGKDFSCGFDVGHGGIQAGEEGWITFSGYGGHLWRIKSKEE